MAPLPVTNTARYKLFYTVNGHQHTQGMRCGVLSPSSYAAYITSYYTAISPQLYAVVLDKVEYAGSGSNIFNPVITGIEGDTYGSGAGTTIAVAQFLDFVGRSGGGRRVRFSQFGMTAFGGDYRFIAGENADVDAAINVLNVSTNAWYSIEGVKPTWYNYANAGANAYWQRKVRP